MAIINISAEQYQKFLIDNDQTHFLRNSKWGQFRKSINWEHEILGYKVDDELFAVALILYKQVGKLPLKVAYSTRGYVLNSQANEEKFISELAIYLKKQGAFVYKIDPDITYSKLDKKLMRIDNINQDAFDNFNKLGFKHLGFHNNFEGLQPRHTIRINTTLPTEQVFQKMDARTRNRSKTGEKIGLEIEFASRDKLPIFLDILHQTSERNEFAIRDDKYFYDMYDVLESNLVLGLAKVNFTRGLEIITREQQQLHVEVAELQDKLGDPNISAKSLKKSTNRLKEGQEKINRNEKIINELQIGETNYPDGKYIAGTLSIVDEGKCWYLYGGTLSQYRYMFPSYGLLGKMVEYCCDNNFEYFDLFGIGGNFDETNHYFGIYKFKRGFGGQAIEFVGEFELPIRKNLYFLYNRLYPILQKIKRH